MKKLFFAFALVFGTMFVSCEMPTSSKDGVVSIHTDTEVDTTETDTVSIDSVCLN